MQTTGTKPLVSIADLLGPERVFKHLVYGQMGKPFPHVAVCGALTHKPAGNTSIMCPDCLRIQKQGR